MTTKRFNKILFALAVLCSFMVTACAGLFNDELEEKAELYISVNNNARNILPQVSQLTDLKLTGTKNNETTTLGEWTSTEALSAAAIVLDAGEWNFTLTAKHGTVSFSGTASAKIKSGSSNSISFALSTQSTENGTVNVNVQYPQTCRVKAARVFFGNSEDNELQTNEFTFSSTNIRFKKNLPAGTYLLKIIFYSDTNKSDTSRLGVHYENVVVCSGLDTNADITIDYIKETPVFKSIKSIDDGIQFEVVIPANTALEITRRMVTDNSKLSEPHENWCWGARSIAIVANNLTSETVTKVITDRYGIEAGKTYQYGMILDWCCTVSPETTYVIAENDGWGLPVITKKFKAEFDSNKRVLKYTQKPVISFQNGETNKWRVKTWYNRQVYDPTTSYGGLNWYWLYYESEKNTDEWPISEDAYGLTVNYATTELELVSNDGNDYYTYIHYDSVGNNETRAMYEEIPQTIFTPNKVEETSEGIKIKFPVPKSTYYIRMFRKIGNGEWIKIMDCWNGPSNPVSEFQTWQFCDKYEYQANVENQYYLDYCYVSNGNTYGYTRFDSNQGFSYTPKNNGIQKPTFTKVPAASFDGEKLTISDDFDVTYYNNESSPDSQFIPYLNFCFIDENYDEIWCYYRPNGSHDSVYDLYNSARNNKTYTLQYFYLGFHWPDNQNIAGRWEYFNNTENASLFQDFEPVLHFADKRPAMTLTTAPAATFTDGKTFTMTSHAVATFAGIENPTYRTELVYKDSSEPNNSSKKITITDNPSGELYSRNLYSDATAGTIKVLESAKLILTTGSETITYELNNYFPQTLSFVDDRLNLQFDSAQNVKVWTHGETGFDSTSINISDGTYTIVTDASILYKIDTVANVTYNINWCDNWNKEHRVYYTIENNDWTGFVDSRIRLINADTSSVVWTYNNGNQIGGIDNDDETPMRFTGTGNPVYIKVNSAKCAFRVWK